MITRRTFLKTTAGGLAVLGAGVVAADRMLFPALGEKAPGSRIYDYVYGMPKCEAVDFVLDNITPDSRFCFGSSEFFFNADLIPEIALKVFGDHTCGLDLTLIGEPFDQSLWQAIAAGAYCGRARNRQCILFLSPQWFFKGNGRQDLFSGKFNYEIYRAFCGNTMLSQTTKDRIRERCRQLGVDETLLAAANRDTPTDAINDLGIHEKEALRIRSELPGMIAGSPSRSQARLSTIQTGEPDWEAWMRQADKDGAERCTNNPLGIYDAYWTKNKGYTTERGQNFEDAEAEWSDLQLYLDVVHECGMSSMMIMLPMLGPWYDYMGVDRSIRDVWYDRARKTANDNGIVYADFLPCEYERYFFCDTVHPGWRGWVRLERAIWNFIHGTDDAFLGGWGWGEAHGKGLEDMRGVKL